MVSRRNLVIKKLNPIPLHTYYAKLLDVHFMKYFSFIAIITKANTITFEFNCQLWTSRDDKR